MGLDNFKEEARADGYGMVVAGAKSVMIDFEGREEMYKELEESARAGFRTMEGQILFELSEKSK